MILADAMPSDPPLPFTEQMDYEKGFSAYFAGHIVPLLGKLEQDRQQALRQFFKACLAGALIVIVGGTFLYLLSPTHSAAKTQGSIFLFIMAGLCPCLIYTKYANESKSVLLQPLLSFFGDLKYFTESFDVSRLRVFKILPAYDRYSSKDHIRGSIDGVGIEMAEINMSVGTGKSRAVTFDGIAILLDMKKPCAGETLVRHSYGSLGRWMGLGSEGLELVTLEDPNFQKTFTVYASDQVEARCLLTPTFMEQVMDLSALMHHWGNNPASFSGTSHSRTGQMDCDFLNSHLLLMIPCSKDLFATGDLFHSALRVDEIRCVLYQIFLIRRIVETLKLSQH